MKRWGQTLTAWAAGSPGSVLRGAVSVGLLCALGACSVHAQQPWPLWENYARHFIEEQGRVVDHSAQDRTTSEGQSYALFFALVANDRARFDKLLSWTQMNLAEGDLTQRLPAWVWGKNPDGSWKTIDPNPASDADLWIAYSLLEAGRLWHEPRYERLGIAIAASAAQREVAYVPGVGTTLLSGAVGFHPDANTWILNPSYMPPFLLRRLAKVAPSGPWSAVLESLQPILTRGSGGGFAMDWVQAGNEIRPSASPAQIAGGDAEAMPIGSYDAIRVYLWLGLSDPEMPGIHDLLTKVPGMGTYLKSHVTPPERVDGTGRVIGLSGPPGFSAALVPYLTAAGMRREAAAQVDRLAASRVSGLYGRDAAYYDQNLALFSTGWSERRFRFDRDGRITVNWH